jgi:hypothetical protein
VQSNNNDSFDTVSWLSETDASLGDNSAMNNLLRALESYSGMIIQQKQLIYMQGRKAHPTSAEEGL